MNKPMVKRGNVLQHNHGRPLVVMQRKPRRNNPCPCGSGKKFKVCCDSRKVMGEQR